MKVQRETRYDKRIGVQDEGEFTIKTSPELFSLLSDGLYTDKVLAVVRELSCNAWDAHKEAGNENIPFVMHLPNDLEPFFSIRDFGTGLSHRDVLTLYTTYGESTKNNSNDYIGALGVGSKSPFAYGDSFTVTSFFGGERRSYTAFLSAEGIPSIAMMGTAVPSTEPNGLEISLPVSKTDFYAFKQKSVQVLKRFDPIPTVTAGTEEFLIPPATYSMEGNGWKIRERDYSTAYAIQGKIAYPIDVPSMDVTSPEARTVLKLPIDIDFPIGSLDIAASREGLGYKPRTVKSLVARAEEIHKEISEIVSEKMKSAKTLWQARVMYWNMATGNDPLTALKIQPMWKGLPVEHTIPVETKTYPGLLFYTPYLNHNYNLSKEMHRYSFRMEAKSNTRFFIDDVNRGVWTRMKHFLSEDPSLKNARKGTVILIRISDEVTGKKSLQELRKDLGKPAYEQVSNLSKPPKKPAEVSADILIRDLSGFPRCDRENWNDTDDVDLKTGGFYVEIQNRRTIDLQGNRYHEIFTRYNNVEPSSAGRDINKLVKFLIKLDILKDGVKVYGIKTRFMKEIKQNKKWVNLFEFAVEKLQKHPHIKSFGSTLENERIFEKLTIPEFLANSNPGDFADVKNKKFHEFMDAYYMVRKQANKLSGGDDRLTRNILNGLSIDLTATAKTTNLVQMYNELITEAPLIPWIRFGYRGIESKQMVALAQYLDSME